MNDNKHPLQRPDPCSLTRIQENSSAFVDRPSAFLECSGRNGSSSSSSNDERKVEIPPRDSTMMYRKLKRRNGDYNGRVGLGSNGRPRRHCSVSSNQKDIGKAVGVVTRSVLVLVVSVMVLQIQRPSIGWAEAAYLNGVNPDLSKGLPPRTSPTTKTETKPKRPSTKNKRYAFVSRPMDNYFTSTGILPPLAPSSSEDHPTDLWVSPVPTTTQQRSQKTATAKEGGSAATTNTIAVTYTNDPDTVDAWLCRNVPFDGCFLGFDIERLPECRSTNPDLDDRSDFAHAAVVQLATNSACLVVHLVDSGSTLCHRSMSSSEEDGDDRHSYYHHPKHSNDCARILKTALEDTSIVKAGCSIDEDLVLLHELWGKPRGSEKSVRVQTKRDGKGRATLASQHNPKAVQGSGGWDLRTNQRRHHPNSSYKSRNEKSQYHPRNIHHHRTSLQARSRFDLGCVVLPKTIAGTGSTSDDGSDGGIPTNEDPVPSAAKGGGVGGNARPPPPQPHFKIMAKRTTTIPNKSGLQGLCRAILGVDLPKEKEDCASDWTRFPLTDDQITYAARDAWAGVAIATKLASMSVEDTSSSNSNRNNSTSGIDRPGSDRPGNDVFSLSNLIRVLGKSETPLPHLAKRHRQRKNAKIELETMLHPFTKNLFLNQQNHRRHRELSVLRENKNNDPPAATNKNKNSNGNNTGKTKATSATSAPPPPIARRRDDEKIDVQALFAGYPLSIRRSLADYGQQQHQLMEKSLPKRIKKRSLVLRQIVNARVIDHKVVFEIKLVRSNNNKHNNHLSDGAATAASKGSSGSNDHNQQHHQREYHSSEGRLRHSHHHHHQKSTSLAGSSNPKASSEYTRR